MNQVFIDTTEDMTWLLDTYLPLVRKAYLNGSAIIYGNEDSPDKIELYYDNSPNIDDQKRTFLHVTNDNETYRFIEIEAIKMKTKYTINAISGEGDYGTNSTHTITSVSGMKRILTKLLCNGDRWAFFSSESIPYFSSPVERYYIQDVDDMFALLTKRGK